MKKILVLAILFAVMVMSTPVQACEGSQALMGEATAETIRCRYEGEGTCPNDVIDEPSLWDEFVDWVLN